MNKSTHLKQGFTLIELLVVIAIIGALFAIAMPVFENMGRKDTNRAAQQVMNTLRLARQHAISKRQWTFVVFPNRDGVYTAGAKGVTTVDKCLRSYAVIAATNNLDTYKMYDEDAAGPTIDDMDLEFVSDWKYLPEGIYFDDNENLTGNFLFGKAGYYVPASAGNFKFPMDPAKPKIRTSIMSAVMFKPTGRMYTMIHTGDRHWSDGIKNGRLYLTSAQYYEESGAALVGPTAIAGTNTTIQFQAKTGMVKIWEADVP